MRSIGKIKNQAQARQFLMILLSHAIEAELDTGQDGARQVWVHREDQLEQAGALLAAWQQNPADPKWEEQAAAGSRQIEQKADKVKRVAEQTIAMRNRWDTRKGSIAPLTLVLIALSVLATLYTDFCSDRAKMAPLQITERILINPATGNWSKDLPEVRSGQVWRLITTIFPHITFLHILFNMLWLKDLGTVVEKKSGPFVLLLLVLFTAAPSNVAQFYFESPLSAGFSGVVYGLLGFIWMRTRFDPKSGYYIHKETVTFMLIWLFLCLTGLVGNIANTAHFVGIGTGMLYGLVASKAWRRWLTPPPPQ